jgi:hypothetical protein
LPHEFTGEKEGVFLSHLTRMLQAQFHWVLVQFEDTPKAFAKFSPGLLQPWVQGQDRPNAESVH